MGAEVGREAQVEVESSTWDHVHSGALRDQGGPAGACLRQSSLLRPPSTSHFMSRSQRPKKEKAIPAGQAATLHSFFGSATQPPSIRTPVTPAEIIIIDSGDENPETSPTQPKRKALNDPDTRGSPGSKRGKLSRNAAQSVPENDSLLKPVPPSSLNCSVGPIEGDLCTETNQTQRTMTIVSDWEMGDDEFPNLVDNSQAMGDEDDGAENILDTCPVCGAIFVDFCLSVSVTSPLLMGPYSSHPHSATSSTHQYLYRQRSANDAVT